MATLYILCLTRMHDQQGVIFELTHSMIKLILVYKKTSRRKSRRVYICVMMFVV